MTFSTLSDNDILIKCSCYRLLQKLLDQLPADRTTGFLGAARFVVPHHLKSLDTVLDQDNALEEFEAFSQRSTWLEPTEGEISLATRIEDAAQGAGLEVDTGESQLCAIAIRRGTSVVLTGDKRAVEGLEIVAPSVPHMGALRGTIGSLEQLVLTLTSSLGIEETRRRVCAEPYIDKTLQISFSCSSETPATSMQGLISHIRHLQARAPSMLVGSLSLSWQD